MGIDFVFFNFLDDCKCGYFIFLFNDEYFFYKFVYIFFVFFDGNVRDGFVVVGWLVNDGKYVGGVVNGNRCWGNKDNVNIDLGDLVLIVLKD